MVLPAVGSPKTQKKSNDIKIDPSYLVIRDLQFLARPTHVYHFFFQNASTCGHQLLSASLYIPNGVALLVCTMGEMGRSRMVLPGAGSPKTKPKLPGN